MNFRAKNQHKKYPWHSVQKLTKCPKQSCKILSEMSRNMANLPSKKLCRKLQKQKNKSEIRFDQRPRANRGLTSHLVRWEYLLLVCDFDRKVAPSVQNTEDYCHYWVVIITENQNKNNKLLESRIFTTRGNQDLKLLNSTWM